MNVDRYTKTILTIIAISLTAIALQNTIKSANAQIYSSNSGVQLVAICNMQKDPGGVITCADIVDGGRLRIANK